MHVAFGGTYPVDTDFSIGWHSLTLSLGPDTLLLCHADHSTKKMFWSFHACLGVGSQ